MRTALGKQTQSVTNGQLLQPSDCLNLAFAKRKEQTSIVDLVRGSMHYYSVQSGSCFLQRHRYCLGESEPIGASAKCIIFPSRDVS